MDRNSNAYTFIFAIILVAVVASVLAFTATSLQPAQNENVRKEKMQNILATVGIEVARDSSQPLYEKYITEQLTLNYKGEEKSDVDAFSVDLKKQVKMPKEEQSFPIYVANVESSTYYIIPLYGKGLWNAIYGYVALEDDVNTVKGVVFDHIGETPGLGAEITQDWFMKRFEEEKILNGKGEFVGVNVKKGYSGGDDKSDNAVDAISGATITGDGVTDMIQERVKNYLPYLNKQKN